jgi:hypothetical protein
MKTGFALLAALAAASAAVPADATMLRYTLTGTNGHGAIEYAQFDIDTNRLPDDYEIGVGLAFFSLAGTYTYNLETIHLDDMYFYNADYGGGIFGQSNITATDGPQLYTGPENAPTLLTGTFALTDYYWHSPLTLTVTEIASVPEPLTWAMMAGGFALTGAAMRRRNKTAAAATA